MENRRITFSLIIKDTNGNVIIKSNAECFLDGDNKEKKVKLKIEDDKKQDKVDTFKDILEQANKQASKDHDTHAQKPTSKSVSPKEEKVKQDKCLHKIKVIKELKEDIHPIKKCIDLAKHYNTEYITSVQTIKHIENYAALFAIAIAKQESIGSVENIAQIADILISNVKSIDVAYKATETDNTSLNNIIKDILLNETSVNPLESESSFPPYSPCGKQAMANTAKAVTEDKDKAENQFQPDVSVFNGDIASALIADNVIDIFIGQSSSLDSPKEQNNEEQKDEG